MTAPAAAPIAPAALAAPRVAPQPLADRFAFASVLDSLPSAGAKAGAPVADEQPHSSKEPGQDESQRGQSARHSLMSDGALLASLPFALRAAPMMDKAPGAADHASSPAATKGSGSESGGASVAAGASTASLGRLIGESAFHSAASASAGALASRALTTDAPFGAAEARSATPLANAVPSIDNPPAAASIARAGAPPANRLSTARAAAHEAARSAREPEVSATPLATRAAASATVHAPARPSGDVKEPDGRSPASTASAVPSAAQTDSFGALPPAQFAVGSSFESDVSTASAADITPRASALAASSTSSAPPVREIDVDLSPGGLEDISMTMRLANEKLSVIIRAASSHTLNSIEGARDAIADRLAAIGQPLDSLIVKQTGVNADGNTNGNAASADDGPAKEKGRSAEGERGRSNDALSRRGAGRDRSF
jgi:Flagellar hook-length control protein FliK